MADVRMTKRTITFHEYTLNSGTPVGEFNKALLLAERDYRAFHGTNDNDPLYDDVMTVEARDDEVVIQWTTDDHPMMIVHTTGELGLDYQFCSRCGLVLAAFIGQRGPDVDGTFTSGTDVFMRHNSKVAYPFDANTRPEVMWRYCEPNESSQDGSRGR